MTKSIPVWLQYDILHIQCTVLINVPMAVCRRDDIIRTARYRHFVYVLTSIMLLLHSLAHGWTPTLLLQRKSLLQAESSHQLDEKVEFANDDGPNNYQLRFRGVGRLYSGKSTNRSKEQESVILARLQNAVVVVIGLGGVGSWAAEALCRSGVGTLVLVDLDDVCISNTNRQLHALSSTTGQMKIDTMRERLLQINPSCKILLVHDFVTADNVQNIFGLIEQQLQISTVMDAIDGAKEKAAIISYCAKHKLPIITCGGAAGRTDPGQILCQDLTRAEGDKLLASCKKELRKHYGFEAGLPFRDVQKGKRVKKWHIDCVYSEEEVAASDMATTSSSRQCDGALGTACFVTGTFGFVAAAAVVDAIANDKLRTPRGRH
jgi:tRNA threonylcarbamoyladenosine dehydratase